MKVRIRPHDVGVPEDDEWRRTDLWLAGLRDNGRADPASGRHTPLTWSGDPRPGVPAQVAAPAETRAAVPAAAPAHAEASVGSASTVRPVIGDQLRMPASWCEMGSCISRYTDPAALGEADVRARAVGAGWRVDALGRLACPHCQQTDPCFWATAQVVLWDRYIAMARAARLAAASGRGWW